MQESIISKIVMTSDGSNAWGLSQSGLINLPIGNLYNYPILQPETTTVFLSVDQCNPGVASGTVRINNLGKGRMTVSVPNSGTALVAEVTSGLAPTNIKLTMEPGRGGEVRQAGTNVVTGTANLQGTAFNLNVASLEAINIPNNIRVFMNYRQPDQRGVIYPVPTTPNNSPTSQSYPNGQGNEGLQDMVLDEPRGVLYITNSGYNRIEVFDIHQRQFLTPITGRPVTAPDGHGDRRNHALRREHGWRIDSDGGSRSAPGSGQRAISGLAQAGRRQQRKSYRSTRHGRGPVRIEFHHV